MAVQPNAQAFYLGSNQATNGTDGLSATAALPLLIDDVIFPCDIDSSRILGSDWSSGTIDTLRIAGQSVMASNKSMPLAAFAAQNASRLEAVRSLGLTIDTNQSFTATYTAPAGLTVTNAQPIAMALSTSPTDVVISPNNSPVGLLNFAFGLGTATIGEGASATFEATSLRDAVFLGAMVGDYSWETATVNKSPTQLAISSIEVDGIELLSNSNPTNEPLNFQAILAAAADSSGLEANYLLSQNSICRVTVVNNHASKDCTVALGFFCRPLTA